MADAPLHPALMHDQYLFRKKVFKLFGGAFHVYDKDGQVVLYSEQKAFKLKEDFRIYSDEYMSEELFTIKTPQILDISATYYVQDGPTGQPVGAIRRKGFKSIIRDEWIFLSNADEEIGTLTETSLASALLSRFINLIPQTYVIRSSTGRDVAVMRQHFNPFVLKYTMDITDPEPPIDRRLLLSAGVLLAAMEGRQQ